MVYCCPPSFTDQAGVVLFHRDQRLRVLDSHDPTRPNDLDSIPAHLRALVFRRLDLFHEQSDLLPRRQPFHIHRWICNDPPDRSATDVGTILWVLFEHGVLCQLPDRTQYEFCQCGRIHKEKHGELDGMFGKQQT